MIKNEIKFWQIRVGRYESYWEFLKKSKLNYLVASSIWMSYVAEKFKWEKKHLKNTK